MEIVYSDDDEQMAEEQTDELACYSQVDRALREAIYRLKNIDRAREHRRTRPFTGSIDIEPAKLMFATLEDYCSYAEAYRVESAKLHRCLQNINSSNPASRRADSQIALTKTEGAAC